MSAIPAADPPELTPEAEAARDEARKRDAVRKKLEFQATTRNAQAKAAELDRRLIPTLAFGATGLMLSQVLAGIIEPKDAKQALEVAKMALDIARTETGEGQLAPELMDADTRAAKIAEAKATWEEIVERTKKLEQPIAGEPPTLVAVNPDWDLGDG